MKSLRIPEDDRGYIADAQEHMAIGLVALLSSTAVSAWHCRFLLLAEPTLTPWVLRQTWRVGSASFGTAIIVSNNSSLATGQALYTVGMAFLTYPFQGYSYCCRSSASRIGSHALPRGRLARPAITQHLRCCTLCVVFWHQETKGILSLIAPRLPTSAASFGYLTKVLTVPCSGLCGTRTRRLSAIA